MFCFLKKIGESFLDVDGKPSCTRILAFIIIMNVLAMCWYALLTEGYTMEIVGVTEWKPLELSSSVTTIILTLVGFSVSALGLNSFGGKLLKARNGNGNGNGNGKENGNV